MEVFFKDHWELVISFIVLLLGLLSFFIKSKLADDKISVEKVNNKIDEMEEFLENIATKTELKDCKKEVEDQISEVKSNYVDRFDKMDNKLDHIVSQLTKVSALVNEQAGFCKAVQELKRRG